MHALPTVPEGAEPFKDWISGRAPGNAATSKFSTVRARSHDGRSRGRQASVREVRSPLDPRSPPLASTDCGPTPSIPGILALNAQSDFQVGARERGRCTLALCRCLGRQASAGQARPPLGRRSPPHRWRPMIEGRPPQSLQV